MSWTTKDIPNQSGRIVIVTGANSGLGFETSKALAARNARVIMAVRSLSKGEQARQAILKVSPKAQLEVMRLDLADLASVRHFAREFRQGHERLDLLFNNAGIMAPPLGRTGDGFETQFGVNHLGHFALTGLLLPALSETPGSRVVTVTSFAHYFGRIPFRDLDYASGYMRYAAYSNSKLANVLFAFELQRRLERAGLDVRSLSAHPGFARTNLQSNAAQNSHSRLEGGLYAAIMPFFAQSQAAGALPQLRAAIDPQAQGGRLYGPRWIGVGAPVPTWPAPQALKRASADKLWQISEEMTGVYYMNEESQGEKAAQVRLSSGTTSPRP